MEDIKERLGDNKYNFFKNLQNYLETELMFFGSVKRLDYFKNSSDFDIVVISDNVSNTLTRVKNYLHIDKNDVKKVYQNFREISPTLVIGHKIKYEDVKNNLSFDILIYDEKYREIVLKEMDDSNNMPFYMIVILYILKCIYYNLGLMSSSYYIYIKRIVFSMYQNKKFLISEKDTARNIVLDKF
jgi:predicted nucleotidyltransferase